MYITYIYTCIICIYTYGVRVHADVFTYIQNIYIRMQLHISIHKYIRCTCACLRGPHMCMCADMYIYLHHTHFCEYEMHTYIRCTCACWWVLICVCALICIYIHIIHTFTCMRCTHAYGVYVRADVSSYLYARGYVHIYISYTRIRL